MTSKDELKEAFSAGYQSGWKARGEYITDYRNSITGTSIGMALMMLSGMVFVIFALTPFFYAVVAERIITMLLVTALMFVAGYFINKAETKSYAKKQTEFKEKWGD